MHPFGRRSGYTSHAVTEPGSLRQPRRSRKQAMPPELEHAVEMWRYGDVHDDDDDDEVPYDDHARRYVSSDV